MCECREKRWRLLTASARVLLGLPAILSTSIYAGDPQSGWSWHSASTEIAATHDTAAAAENTRTSRNSSQPPLYRPSDLRFSSSEPVVAESYVSTSSQTAIIPAAYQVSEPGAPEAVPEPPPVSADTGRPFFELAPSVSDKQSNLSGVKDSGEAGSDVVIRGLAWLIVTLCLLSLTILGLRRWQKHHGLLPTTNGRSRVLETLSLGPGRTVSLIEMNGLRALVGSDAGGIRTIVLAPPTFEDEMRQADGPDLRVSSMHS